MMTSILRDIFTGGRYDTLGMITMEGEGSSPA